MKSFIIVLIERLYATGLTDKEQEMSRHFDREMSSKVTLWDVEFEYD
jgi:hypothetical protein